MNENIIQLPVFSGWDAVKDIFRIIDGRGWIAGSYAARMTYTRNSGTWRPNDIDIFATSPENARAIMLDIEANTKYLLDTQNDVAYGLYARGRKPLQIVKPSPQWSSFPDDIIESFDLDICRAILIDPKTCLADRNAGLMRGKVLRINNPLRTLKRIQKYQKRGVEFTDHELLKVFQAWEQASLEHKTAWLEAARITEISTSDDSEGWDYDDDQWFEGE